MNEPTPAVPTGEPRPRVLLLVPVAVGAALLDLLLRRGFANIATEVLDLDLALAVERITRFVSNAAGLAVLVGLGSLVRAVFREPSLRLGPFRRMVVGGLAVVVVGTLFTATVLPEERFHAVPLLTLTLTGYGAAFVLSTSFASRDMPPFGRLACLGLTLESFFGAIAAVATLVSALTASESPIGLSRPVESTLEVGYFTVPAFAALATLGRERLLLRLGAAGLSAGLLGGLVLLAARYVPDAFGGVVYRAFHAGGVANLPSSAAAAVVASAFGCAVFAVTDARRGGSFGLGALGVLAAGCAPVSPLGIGVLVLAAASLCAEPDAEPGIPPA